MGSNYSIFLISTIFLNLFSQFPMIAQTPIFAFEDENVTQILGKKTGSLSPHYQVDLLIEPDVKERFRGFVLDGKIIFKFPVIGFDSSNITSVLFHMDSSGTINTIYFDLQPKDPNLIQKLLTIWGKPFLEMRFGSEDSMENQIQPNYSWKLQRYNALYLQGNFPDANLIILKDDTKTFLSY